ncbi:MAG: tetratricopeptide repeat protein, partial [Myxococcales bacterium]|nr:tetratricopeptide repeat protein [Myxococcales bacterium]
CVGKDKKGEFTKTTTACTHENALGTCEMKVGDLEEAVHYYKKAGATEAGLKKTCEDAKGTWVPEAAAAGSASAAAGSAAPAAGSAAPKK